MKFKAWFPLRLKDYYQLDRAFCSTMSRLNRDTPKNENVQELIMYCRRTEEYIVYFSIGSDFLVQPVGERVFQAYSLNLMLY